MMRLSTKGRYGARLMLDLAIHYGQGSILLKDVARRQEISEKYLGHLISPLKGAGLITSSRGAHGGYVLTKAPEDINLGDVVQAVEGTLSLVECVKVPSVCHRVDSCVTRDIWGELSEKIVETLESITLEDMVDRQRKKEKPRPLTYNI